MTNKFCTAGDSNPGPSQNKHSLDT